ncbi:dyslexia-associated protein kiaa0319-like protein [Biomphalaria glabrata]
MTWLPEVCILLVCAYFSLLAHCFENVADVTKLTVSAGTNKTLQLPENSVSLTAYVIPAPETGETYTYEWQALEVPQNAETAKMDGKNTNTLHLSDLVVGLYVIKIKVTGNNKFGEAVINVTVLPPKRNNQPPQAIIVPSFQEVYLPNSAILEGSNSKDDDKIVSYKWEEVSGPLKQDDNLILTEQMLTLKDMVPGNYTFRLTVTDTDGATSSAQANVTVKKEKDYPPKADAGSDVVIHLPQTSLNLSGIKSSDDKGNLTYEWINSGDEKMTVGMVGVRSPVLQLSNLNVGDYKFTLKVTDSAGQTDSAEVHVFVKPQTNHPPEAKTAGHLQVFLPQESLTLDGSNSTDDSSKMEYAWSQIEGPTSLTINNANSVVALATGNILEGDYKFLLTVTDGELQKATDQLIVTVKKDINLPPRADAGGNQVLQLPISLVTLDGSKSSDDRGITKYLWKRDSKSLAAGAVVNNSDHKAVLQLVNLVAGQYLFTLTVEDADGQQNTDSATVIINKNPHEKDVVEMLLDADINHFTVAHKESLEEQLELMLQKSPEDRNTIVDFISISEDLSNGHLCLRFQVSHRDRDIKTIVNGVQALQTLKSKLGSGRILDYSVVRVDLSVCQNNCSGHGHCDQKSKLCVCEAFWMPNFFTSSLFGSESNCDWSVLYVVIICFIILVSIISAIWAIICCCTSKNTINTTPCCWLARKCKFTLKTKRRHRYSLLHDADESDKDKLEMLTKGKIQNSSVMISESDLSSDEETLFISSKKLSNGINGKVTNNNLRPGHKSKLKT